MSFSFFSWRRTPTIDRYHIEVVTVPEELEMSERLPLELRFVLSVRPERSARVRELLQSGIGIGLRTVRRTPEHVLKAIDHLAHETQHNTVVPWLEDLLRDERLPTFTEEELRTAESRGINLYQDTKTILEQRFEFKKLILVPLHNQTLTEADRAFARALNEDLYPFAIDFILHRVLYDNAHTRTEVAQSIIKGLLVIGPIAHLLEHVLSGIGKVFAASADDLLSETAELFALRGSGFSWRVLFKRSRILVPMFAIATVGAFQVEPLLRSGRLAIAGIVFGFSAVLLSLTTAIQSIYLYRSSYQTLHAEGKLSPSLATRTWSLAIRQDFTNPARLGLFIGAMASPCVAAIVFSFFPTWTSNGWILAMLGSVESIVAGLTVYSAAPVSEWRFRRRIHRVMQDHGSSTRDAS